MNVSKNTIVILFAFIVSLLLLRQMNIGSCLSIENLQSNSASLLAYVQQHYLVAALIYLMVYAALIACALPVVAPMTILGGYLFGVINGVIFACIGASCGAVVYFLLVRYLFAHTVQEKYAVQLHHFHDRMTKYGASYLISLQLLTIIPYFVINTLAALADVSLLTFIWTTILGGLPLHTIYAYAGRELATLHHFGDILKPSIIVLLILMAIVAALPVVIRFIRERYGRK